MAYTTITTEGGLLPAEILDAVAAGEIDGQRAEDFGMERSRRLSDQIAAAWNAVKGQWQSFQFFAENRLKAGDAGTSITRERWVLPLLDVLGYQISYNQAAYLVEGRTYAISHRAGTNDDAPPVHIEGIRTNLDTRPPSGKPRLSPHALLQEYLNSTEQVWGIVTNGERLRLLRDNSRFTRPAYVEFDLRSMLEGEKFNEFAILYRLLHRSRLPQGQTDATSCLLERYHQRAVETGGRVRDGLRDGVEGALKLLGNGLLRHPANAALRQKLAAGLASGKDGDGMLTPLGYYRQLLRLVYRVLFLMVAEERNLIAAELDETDPLSPSTYRPKAEVRLQIYRDHYSVARLRRLAESSGAGRGPHADLWLGLWTTFDMLEGSDEQSPRSLGLAPLDGALFGAEALADLSGTMLTNADLLRAVRALSLYRDKESKALRRVNYAALDVEELGSVYESLLDYRPVASPEGALPAYDAEGFEVRFFNLATGTERKTTGSYYTRPELVQELIKSALVPVMEERLKAAGADPKAREKALLAIRVVDPACGSGAFLLAAARRLGRELAKVRTGEEQPTPTQFRLAVREVIQRCIFGVDLNPLAVDLCKLGLWLEGHSAGMPLSFLDHHIKRGNSLIGATRKLVEAGIPDDAYKAVTGDDKATASSIKKGNKQDRELYLKQGRVQTTLFDLPAAAGGPSLADELRRLDEQADDSVAAVRSRAMRYRQLQDQAINEKIAFDLWTAAFFQPLTPENAKHVPTTRDLLNHKTTPKTLRDPKVAMAVPLAEEVGFFHWEQEFPQVFEEVRSKKSEGRSASMDGSPFSTSGFDVVLGNPPWEQIELKEEEHWVDVPEIANAVNKASREKKIASWRDGDESQRARVAKFNDAKYRAEAEGRFMRASERFSLTAVGRLNTYALFAQHCHDLLMSAGRVGVIVPTGIATDDSTKLFFNELIGGKRLVSLYDFENSEGIFPGVHRSYKFSLITIGVTKKPTSFLFFASNIHHLNDEQRAFNLSSSDIILLNPNTRTAPVFRTKADVEIAKSIYKQIPVLHSESKSLNPWGASFQQGLFNMASNSSLFAESPNSNLVPLYEAKMLHQYSHRWAKYEMSFSRDMSLNELSNPDSFTEPRYWVHIQHVENALKDRDWKKKWLLSFRDIARNTDERTAIFSLLPRVGVGHTAPLVFLSKARSILLWGCFLSVVNSLVFDFTARQKLSGTHLTFTILNQLPVLPPDRFTPADVAFIVPRVVELVYTAWDIKAFAEDVWAEADSELRAELLRRNAECNADADPALFAPRDGFPLPPYRWNDERRALARAELDARIARLYGLTRDELRYILDPADVYGPEFPGETFRVLKEKEIKQFGEYRTRRLVLEAWDREEVGRQK